MVLSFESDSGSFWRVLNSGYMENVQDIDVGADCCYILDLDNNQFRAYGQDLDDVEIKLEIEELVRYVIEWSKGNPDEDYDPEKELIKLQESAKRRLAEKQEFEKQRWEIFFAEKAGLKNSFD